MRWAKLMACLFLGAAGCGGDGSVAVAPLELGTLIGEPVGISSLDSATINSLFLDMGGTETLVAPIDRIALQAMAEELDAGRAVIVGFAVGGGSIVETVLRPSSSERRLWTGEVLGAESSSAFVSRSGADQLQAVLQVGSTVYEITGVQEELHVIRITQQQDLRPEGPPRRPPRDDQPPPTAADTPDGVVCDTPASTVDVLVAASQDALREIGGRDQLTQWARMAIDVTNAVLDASGVEHRVALIGQLVVDYPSTLDMDLDLDRLAHRSDGFLDDVLRTRDDIGADVVSLWVSQAYDDYCGLGYVLSGLPRDGEWALHVVGVDCVFSTYSFAHELGHNLGSEHDRANADAVPAREDSYGYQVPGRFRTVMAYECDQMECPRIPVFSSPSRVHLGAAAGVVGAADNASAFQQEALCRASQWR